MPKQTGRIRRRISAVGRGFVRAGKAALYGAKVLTGKQLTQRKLRKLKFGPSYQAKKGSFGMKDKMVRVGSSGDIQVVKRYFGRGHMVADLPRNQKNLHFTADGKLDEKSTWTSTKGTKTIQYSPPASFIGRRVRPKRPAQ